MSIDEKVLQALEAQQKILDAMQADFATTKTAQQEQGKLLKMANTRLAGVETRLSGLERTLGEVEQSVNRVQKDMKLVLKYHDGNVLRVRSRIERLEEHTNLGNG